jgi:hypothetical protein
MSQVGERERVKARIRALAEKTVSNGCTEAEAMAAAEMVGRLLERYALTMEEIDVRAEPCVRLDIPVGGARRRPIDLCLVALARFCDCKVWLAREEGALRYVFFGFATDTAMAGYLYAVVDRAMATALRHYRADAQPGRGADLRRASVSFQQGMAARIAARLEAMHRQREAGLAARRGTGTALTLVKHDVVEAAFRAQAVRLVKTRASGMAVNGAFRAGQAAGDAVNLRRPVQGDPVRLLGMRNNL